MKLANRFFLSHGAVVLLAVLIGAFSIYEGTRLFYQRQARLNQEQLISDFALAAHESMIQHEDVADLNFMKSVTGNPTVAYAVYINFLSGIHMVIPRKWETAVLAEDGRTRDGNAPRLLHLEGGMDVLEWSRSVGLGTESQGVVRIGYSISALNRNLREQTDKWLGLEFWAGVVALLAGLLVSVGLGRQLAAPLRKIREGTQLVRAGKLDSLVEVNRKDEIGDLARDFNAMVAQLKELDEMKRDFTAGVTHDLGTPLHAIRSAINYLQAGDAGPLTEKQAEYLLMVSNSTSNLTAFINNLLTTARIEAAKVEPFPEPLDVFIHVKEMVDLYQPQAREKGVKLSLVKRTHYISLVADVTMFRQMVMNLLSNALKFTQEGEVEILLAEGDGDFILEVRDTGIGIDRKYHDLVFDKFYRVQQMAGSPARQGSGLGLTIVKGLAEAHKGRIILESALGKGSVFRLILPKQPRRF